MTGIAVQGNQWRISGDILVDNAGTLLKESAELEITDRLQIDFSAVNDVDTAALSLLLQWEKRALSANRKIVFSQLPQTLLSLAALYGVTEFVPLSAD